MTKKHGRECGISLLLVNSRNFFLDNKYKKKKTTTNIGHCSAGQTPLETALREAQEELSLTLQKEEVEFLFRTQFESVHNQGSFASFFLNFFSIPTRTGKYINKEFINVFLVKRDLVLSELVLQKEEVSGVKLIPAKELEKRWAENDPTIVPCFYSARLFEAIKKKHL
jgi:8-oxo-dGTP pyrophosphatase MutT (NUDIX family)